MKPTRRKFWGCCIGEDAEKPLAADHGRRYGDAKLYGHVLFKVINRIHQMTDQASTTDNKIRATVPTSQIVCQTR
jgi:hypothetical protein